MHSGWTGEDARKFILRFLDAVDDEEPEDRRRAIEDTIANFKADKPTTGWKTIAAWIEPNVLDAIRRCLAPRNTVVGGEDASLEVDSPRQPMRNARRFVDAEFNNDERLLLVNQGNQFYSWDGTCWPMLEDGYLRARLYKWFDTKYYVEETRRGPQVKPFAPDRYKIADLVDALRAVTHEPITIATPSWLEARKPHVSLAADEFVACRNGLVHWPTRTLYPPTPRFFVHHSIGFDFRPKPPRPKRWLTFLDEVWGSDDESIETLQELLGYLIAGDTRQQKMFLLVGPKRSGKGTIARVAKAMLGAHHVAGPTLASLGTNFGLSPLIGKPVAIIADARLRGPDTGIVTERLLSISGEDVLTIDRKYREPWTGQLPSRIVILSNELPRLTDSSGALASRFVVLVMTKSFYNREDPDLTDVLCGELPGIFNWALDGLERLRARGRFVQPAASRDAIRDLEDLGSPVGAFIRDECVAGREFSVRCDHLYDAWQRWCHRYGRRSTSAQIFGRDLKSAFPSVRMARPRGGDGSRYRMYEGIRLAVRSGPRTNAM
jgi:putative DNA primase/helicase